MAELVDALVSGTSIERCGDSSSLLGTIVFIRLQAAVELAIQSLQSCHIVTLTMMIWGVISTKNQKIQSITPLLQTSSCKPNEHPAALVAASI